MFRDDYKNELDKLTVSDEFKKQTVQLLQEQAVHNSTTADNKVVFRQRKYLRIAAAVILIMTVSVTAGLHFKASLSVSEADCASTEQTFNEKNSEEFDGIALNSPLADFDNSDVVYTIADAEFAPSGNPQKSVAGNSRIIYGPDISGGMGYEAYSYYSVDELKHNAVYTPGDDFETLPVYEFTPMSADAALNCVANVLDSIDILLPDVEFTWSKPLYWEDGQHYTNEEIVNADAVSPGAEYNLNYIDGKIKNSAGDSGEFSLWATRGRMRISFDSNLSDTDTTDEVIKGVHHKYPGILDFEGCTIYSWYDYLFNGDINRKIYAYEKGDNYGENLFNASVNNISINQVRQYEEDIKPTKTYFWVGLPYYTKAADLPAINYKQALGYLFSGQFYSSYTDSISEDAQIVHIDMTYLPPAYNMEIPGYEGYSVPFYKFYVQTPGVERETPDGIMKEYYVYYVCAIHPDYIQLDENYYRFN